MLVPVLFCIVGGVIYLTSRSRQLLHLHLFYTQWQQRFPEMLWASCFISEGSLLITKGRNWSVDPQKGESWQCTLFKKWRKSSARREHSPLRWLDSRGKKKGKIREQLCLAACRQEAPLASCLLLGCQRKLCHGLGSAVPKCCPALCCASRWGREHGLEELCMGKQPRVSRLLSTSRLPLVLAGGCLSINQPGLAASGFATFMRTSDVIVNAEFHDFFNTVKNEDLVEQFRDSLKGWRWSSQRFIPAYKLSFALSKSLGRLEAIQHLILDILMTKLEIMVILAAAFWHWGFIWQYVEPIHLLRSGAPFVL